MCCVKIHLKMENRAKTPGRVVGIICHSFMAYLQKNLNSSMQFYHMCTFAAFSRTQVKIKKYKCKLKLHLKAR